MPNWFSHDFLTIVCSAYSPIALCLNRPHFLTNFKAKYVRVAFAKTSIKTGTNRFHSRKHLFHFFFLFSYNNKKTAAFGWKKTDSKAFLKFRQREAAFNDNRTSSTTIQRSSNVSEFLRWSRWCQNFTSLNVSLKVFISVTGKSQIGPYKALYGTYKIPNFFIS